MKKTTCETPRARVTNARSAGASCPLSSIAVVHDVRRMEAPIPTQMQWMALDAIDGTGRADGWNASRDGRGCGESDTARSDRRELAVQVEAGR